MDLIIEIRRKNGYDDKMLERIAKDPDIASSMKATLENLEQALRNLSEELYSKSTHFIFEFIQNADDNTYATGVVPTLRMRVEGRRASFHCNEVGFSRENVDAICRVGASTKKHIQGYIGEKGIGFKSVFKVADEVYISSGSYTFKLDKRQKLGMITPIWTDKYPVQAGWTSFHLHLFEDGKKLADRTNDIKPSLLLFLRKLRSLTVEVALSNSSAVKIIEIRRYETNEPDIVTLERIVNGTRVSLDHNLLIKHTVQAYGQEPKRSNCKETEIVLAFPIANDGTPKISAQEVHAFLPLRKYGFTFIIQADFLTSSSREDILSDLQWNLTLRTGVVEAFSRAVKHFQQRPTLEYVWFRYLPTNISDAFFYPLANAINQRLRRTQIFRTMDGVYRLPSEVVILPARFCDDAGQPLIPQQFLTAGMDYLSPEYDVHADGVRFEDLGVCEMDDTFFICCLRRMEGQFSEQSDSWHEAVCLALFNDLQRISKKKRNGRLTEIRRLCLLPLSDGRWISSSNLHNVFFDLKAYNIPNDLGLCSLKAGIKKSSSRYRLFDQLGVKVADPAIVGQKILELHESRSYWTGSVASLICHAQFMFAHRFLRSFPASSNLKVMDELDSIARGSELYMDLPDSQSMLEMLPRPPARFIHPAYLLAYDDESKKDWMQWLRGSLLVNVSPRLVNGDLSPEFVAMARTLKSRDFLLILKSSWSQWQGKLSQNAITKLTQTVVTCGDGTSRTLSATYIGRKSLIHYDLPFLPIDDPDAYHWNFLKQLEVSTEVNGSFFVKRLTQLQKAGCNDGTLIKDTYKQLEARFYDDASGIRQAFRNESLIFAPNNPERTPWISFNEAVWNGPPAMKSKVALKFLYPFLEDFFRVKLGVTNPPMQDLLVHEINLITKAWKGRLITPAVKNQVLQILIEVSALIRMEPEDTTATWLDHLHGEPIFPVDSPNGIRLCRSSEHFYIPDSGKYGKMCAGKVPLLSIDLTRLHDIQALLDHRVFKPRLRYLWKAVHYSSVASGPRILDNAFTIKYANKTVYIERLVYHVNRSDPSSNALKNITSLKHIAIFSVDSIATTFSVDNFEFTDQDNSAIDMEPAKLSILMSSGCQKVKWDLWICERLGKVLGVSKNKLLSIILLPMEMIEEWFESESIPEIAGYPSLDHSWITNTNTVSSDDPFLLDYALPNDADAESPSVLHGKATKSGRGKRRKASNAEASSWNASDLHDEMSATIAAMSHLSIASGQIQSAGTAHRQNSHRLSQFSSPTKYGSVSASTGLVQPQGSGSKALAAGKRVVSSTGAHAVQETVATVYEQQNGILGEYMVYNLFLKELPGFGPDNWTSELRGLVPGMAAYEGSAVVDFVYQDNEGTLTNLWCGEKVDAWKNQWPAYHVEVKATSGTAREAFHMSRRQLEIAFNLNMRDQNDIPEEVFVLLRVCGVRTANPSFTVYVDPHRYLYEGELQIVSDVDVVGI